jgi:hypothetical protein
MKGLVRAQPMWGRICFGCGPTIFLELPVSDPNNEPKLPRYEAVIYLLALIAFVALMVWAATVDVTERIKAWRPICCRL